jgi:hypothetical protein
MQSINPFPFKDFGKNPCVALAARAQSRTVHPGTERLRKRNRTPEKESEISQDVFVPGLLGQPRKIPDVLPFNFDLQPAVVVLEELHRAVDDRFLGGRPPAEGMAVG